MHIAINGYFWDKPRTGSGQYLRHLYSALGDLLARSGRNEAAGLTLLLPGGQEPQRTKGGALGHAAKLAWEEWGMVARAKRRGADLLHSPYLAAPVLKRLPVVVTAHDMIPWVLPGYGGSGAARLYFAFAAAGAKRADLVIADSEASRRDAIRVLKVHPSRVRTVYLGVESAPTFSQEQLDEVRARHGLPRDFAFYLGGFDARKNVPLLLRAWRAAQTALCDEWCAHEKPILAIGGAVPGAGGIFPDVRGVAHGLGLSDGRSAPVRFLGPISEEDKPLLMAAARVFVYPSAYEGFGLDPLEAMSVGCPVVSSSGGSLREVVGDGGLLVPPGDERAFCEAIVRAWSDPALRSDLSERGRARARHFTWERTAEQTLGLYRSVLKRKPG
jgi:glycosyltransferase involved in cell wall biosynthesis